VIITNTFILHTQIKKTDSANNSSDEEIMITDIKDWKWKIKYEKEKEENGRLKDIIYTYQGIYIM